MFIKAIIKKTPVVAVNKPALSQNGLRQCLRVAGGGSLGFIISQLMGWNYGVFFTVFPMFLLGMVPILNGGIIRQFLANVSLNALEVSVVVGLLKHMPVVMTLVVLGLFLLRFNLMAKGPLFLFGANGVLTLSILLHFASYPGVDLSDLLASNIMASLLAVFIAMLMHTLFPDIEPRQLPPRVAKPAAQIRHETLMGGITATLSFVVFQMFDLRDSLSAQMATILILFALGYSGARVSAGKRAIGTLLGCNLALAMQLLLYTQSHHFLLVILLYWLGLMLFAREHILEGGGSGIGFGGLTTLGILFGQSLGPQQDLVYSALYRFSSMSVALVSTLLIMACLHCLLNCWEPTRLSKSN
ncbi:DUF2955 domain-containing protein [Halomonas sp. TD01]|uniref:DUF2955 domain-containing protein n=1 Tax=Halomonas sp. TD01 TaxID=999141 RepID=UPI000214F4D7|nr:DUF2955 domain-containing protein [Halomonas sp. TD01]EGP20587.1 hypothetical protein GME_05705 [Halomonas sp. TD01]CAH1041731.1 Uncharacterized MFS-type transporter [Halomonas sp. TD01]